MRIVLFTMDRLVEFMLPSQVFGTFAFDSNDDEDTKLINIEADNDEWFLYSTTGVRVLDNGNYFTGSDVETALQELGAVKHSHSNKTVLDKHDLTRSILSSPF